MKAKTTLLSIAIFFTATLAAQYSVTPGTGIDKAMLGMPVKDIIKIIGKPSSIVSYEKEKADWQGFGYDVSNKLVFSIEFDHVYIFNNAANQYAIWKIYTRNDSAVIFNQSSYQSAKSITEKITVNRHLRFYDDSMAVKKMFGGNYIKYTDERKNNHVIYKDSGILFIVNENQVRNIFLFRSAAKPKQQQPSPPPCFPGQELITIYFKQRQNPPTFS